MEETIKIYVYLVQEGGIMQTITSYGGILQMVQNIAGGGFKMKVSFNGNARNIESAS